MGIRMHKYPAFLLALLGLIESRLQKQQKWQNIATDRTWRSDINWVIMDYLVSEGYPGAAEKFAQETNICSPTDIDSIRDRVRIRNAIHSGQIEEAIAMINDVDPQVSHIPFSSLDVFEMITPSFHAPLIFASGC